VTFKFCNILENRILGQTIFLIFSSFVKKQPVRHRWHRI